MEAAPENNLENIANIGALSSKVKSSRLFWLARPPASPSTPGAQKRAGSNPPNREKMIYLNPTFFLSMSSAITSFTTKNTSDVVQRISPNWILQAVQYAIERA